MLSKDFLTTFAFLLIHGFCRWTFPVQINLDFFISGLICAHYLAYKIFKWKLNNLSDNRLRKKQTSYFSSDKISFRGRQVKLDFFISGLICTHYLAYKIFKWKLDNLSDTRLRKNRQVTFQATKLALELKIVWFPNFKRETN